MLASDHSSLLQVKRLCLGYTLDEPFIHVKLKTHMVENYIIEYGGDKSYVIEWELVRLLGCHPRARRWFPATAEK